MRPCGLWRPCYPDLRHAYLPTRRACKASDGLLSSFGRMSSASHDAAPREELDDDVPLTKRGKNKSVTVAAEAPTAQKASGGGGPTLLVTGRPKRKAAEEGQEKRSMRERKAKDGLKREGADKYKSNEKPGVKAGMGVKAAKRRDESDDAEKEAPAEKEALNIFEAEDSVLVSFSAGCMFEPGSVVTVSPVEVPAGSPEISFRAKVVKWNAERFVLKLKYENEQDSELYTIYCHGEHKGVQNEEALYLAFSNKVLQRGAKITSQQGTTQAVIKELDAEWHRDQPWATKNEHAGKIVIWDYEDPTTKEQHEDEACIWGYLPADESDFFPDKPEHQGGQPGPLWRIKFSDPKIMPADLDEEELACALERKRKKDKRKKRVGEDKTEEKEGNEEWVPGKDERANSKKRGGNEIDDDAPIRKKKKELLDDEAPVRPNKQKTVQVGTAKSASASGDMPSLKRPGHDSSSDKIKAPSQTNISKDKEVLKSEPVVRAKTEPDVNHMTNSVKGANTGVGGKEKALMKDKHQELQKSAVKVEVKSSVPATLKSENGDAEKALSLPGGNGNGVRTSTAGHQTDKGGAAVPKIKTGDIVSNGNATLSGKPATGVGRTPPVPRSGISKPGALGAGNNASISAKSEKPASLGSVAADKLATLPQPVMVKPVPRTVAPLPKALPSLSALPRPDISGMTGGGISNVSEGEWEGKGRRAPFAHTRFGYAPIYMADLHGVPLPYSELDAAIENLFGPTVVRRKILSEGAEDLSPLAEAVRQPPALEERMQLTPEKMAEMEKDLEGQASARASRRSEEARQEEIEAIKTAATRNAEAARGDSPAVPLPVMAPYSDAAAPAQRVDHASEPSNEAQTVGTNKKPVVLVEKKTVSVAALSAFGWKGQKVKKTNADGEAGQAVAKAELSGISAAHPRSEDRNGKEVGVHTSAQPPTSAQGGSIKTRHLCVEVRVTPEQDECVKLAVDYIKQEWSQLSERVKQDPWLSQHRHDGRYDLTPVWCASVLVCAMCMAVITHGLIM